jgi:hypothetical protein
MGTPIYDKMMAAAAEKEAAKKKFLKPKDAPKAKETGVKTMAKGVKPGQTPKQKIKRGTK